jgi:riboflavin synthase alpha subunit
MAKTGVKQPQLTLQPGALVNLEIDTMARYIARLREYER